MFTEAWVEFEDKHEARAVADALNSTPFGARAISKRQVLPHRILPHLGCRWCAGGGKRGFYSSDLWNIKYLKHFKWHHLTEKIGPSEGMGGSL